ncbi:hypothetical protein ACTQ6A_01660 [Lachnospiraceae bacterium LCP25S3_G4]
MKTENWDVITDEDRCIILKHLHDQYDAMCELCGKDSEEALDRVDSIREVIVLDTTSWRDDTRNLINKMANELGGGQAFSQVRSESYELLDKRMGVNLKQRLTNKIRRMVEEGICKSRRDKLTCMDIIVEDKKLIEGYTAIIKEIAIRYGVA